MMNMKKIGFFLILALVSLSLFAQSNYNEAIQQGDSVFEHAEYSTAIKKYLIAEKFDPSQWKIVQEKLDAVYHAIDTALASIIVLQRELEGLKMVRTQQLSSNLVPEILDEEVSKPASKNINTPKKKPTKTINKKKHPIKYKANKNKTKKR